LVLALEVGVELLDAGQRRVGGQADVRDGAVRGVARELDHLLAREHGRADSSSFVYTNSTSPPLCLAFSTAELKSTWPGSVEMSAPTLMPSDSSDLMIMSRPPFPKSLYTHMMSTVFALMPSLM